MSGGARRPLHHQVRVEALPDERLEWIAARVRAEVYGAA